MVICVNNNMEEIKKTLNSKRSLICQLSLLSQTWNALICGGVQRRAFRVLRTSTTWKRERTSCQGDSHYISFLSWARQQPTESSL